MSKIRVALLVCEFFDNTHPTHNALGGYGMLARHYIAEHIPNNEISVETILGFGREYQTTIVDGRKKLIVLPYRKPWPRMGPLRRLTSRAEHLMYRRGLRKHLRGFDAFLSIETMPFTPTLLECDARKKLILYVQDPRPQQEWDELDSVIGTDDGSPRPSQPVRAFYNSLIRQERLLAVSQGTDLIDKARDLYGLPSGFPIRLLRNPVIVDENFDLERQSKEDAVLFLGRLDPVKRPWLALEIARRMPSVKFYFLGKVQNDLVPYIMQPYCDLPNVHLLGHQAGGTKTELLRRCKVLLNTSIHEAIPVSFLEALANGTLIVSCQNPDRITERFGRSTGKVLGDGRDRADLFVNAIQHILDNEPWRRQTARQAVEYVKSDHGLPQWVDAMRATILSAVR